MYMSDSVLINSAIWAMIRRDEIRPAAFETGATTIINQEFRVPTVIFLFSSFFIFIPILQNVLTRV